MKATLDWGKRVKSAVDDDKDVKPGDKVRALRVVRRRFLRYYFAG